MFSPPSAMAAFAASPLIRRVPPQFSHEILNANPYAYLDDAPLEERRARAVEMRRMLPETVLGEIGRLDPAAIEKSARMPGPTSATPTNCTTRC